VLIIEPGKLLARVPGHEKFKSLRDRVTRVESSEKEDIVRLFSQMLKWLPKDPALAHNLHYQLVSENPIIRDIWLGDQRQGRITLEDQHTYGMFELAPALTGPRVSGGEVEQH
jgi:hypothetical protein